MNTITKIIRSWYYFRLGYGSYVGFGMGLFSFVTTVYYLAIQNIPVLKNVFPNFISFSLATILVVYPLSSVVGWIHLKASPVFRAETEIQIEANQYNQWKISPVMIPSQKLFAALLRERGMNQEAEVIEGFVRRSMNGDS